MSHRIARKTKSRLANINFIVKSIKQPNIYKTIPPTADEKDFANRIDSQLKKDFERLFRDRYTFVNDMRYESKANRAVTWDGDHSATIHHTVLFGVQHRPDFVLRLDHTSFAIEVKKGDDGESVRDGLGQSLIYISDYDFVIYLFIDDSKEGTIVNSLDNTQENDFLVSLWDHYNIRFEAVHVR